MAIIQQKTYGYHTAENLWLSYSRKQATIYSRKLIVIIHQKTVKSDVYSRKLMAIIQKKTIKSDHIQQETNCYHTVGN